MNKIFAFSLLLFGAAAFVSCNNEEDDLFDQSAAERLNAAEKTYSTILASSTGGWAMEYYCTNDTLGSNGMSDFRSVGYLLGAKFNADGTVNMGMNNIFSGNTYQSATSLWDIITDNGPVLSFDSYNPCIHSFSDPGNLPRTITGTSDDVTGLGAEGDFEFVLTDVVADQELATVKGKKRGTYVRMTRLPEGTDFATYIAQCDSFRNAIFGNSNFSEPVMRIGNSALCINSTNKSVTPKIYPYHGDSILVMYRRPFLITKRDGQFYLRFKSNFVVSGDTACQEFVYNNDSQTFTGVGEGLEGYTISGQEPLQFMNDKFALGSWSVQLNGDKSDDLQALFNNFSNGLRRINYSVNRNRFNIARTANGYELNFEIRNNRRQTATVRYNFSGSFENGAFTLAYQSAADAASTNILNAVSSLQDILNALSTTFSVNYVTSPYNLRSLRLSAANGNSFVNVSFN